jgi:hypothetical protein
MTEDRHIDTESWRARQNLIRRGWCLFRSDGLTQARHPQHGSVQASSLVELEQAATSAEALTKARSWGASLQQQR